MTPDERKLLNDLADNVAKAPASARDPEAEDLIRTRIGKRPDALYLMTQTVLIQNMALQRAQQQIQELQQRAGSGQVSGNTSFLGQQQSFGSGGSGPSQQQYSAPPPQYAAPASSGFGGGGFLRGAAQTAAGVAAGTLAAEAIGSMFSHGGGFGGGSGFLGGGGMGPTEEVINNYYDSPSGGDRNDLSNMGGDSFADPSDVSTADDSSQFDDNSSFDDSAFDNGGGFDGGSDDSLV